jgi:hypothetical protein
MSCKETGLFPARYIELPDPLEAFEGVGRWLLVVVADVAMDDGRLSHGGKSPSVDK